MTCALARQLDFKFEERHTCACPSKSEASFYHYPHYNWLSIMWLNWSNTGSDDYNRSMNYTPGVINYNFNNPFDEIHIKATFCTLYSLIFIGCFFGNLMVLFVIIRNVRLRTRTNFFLANLAAADFCVGIFCVYPNLSMYLSPMWHLGRVMCKVYYFTHYMSLTIPVVLLSVISIERYLAILYPLKTKQLFTFRRLRLTQALIWLFLAAYNSPQLIVHDTFTLGDKTFCYMRSDNINTNAYVLANLIVWYILPLFVLSFMYCKIAAVLWRSSSTQNFALQMKRPEVNARHTNMDAETASRTSGIERPEKPGAPAVHVSKKNKCIRMLSVQKSGGYSGVIRLQNTSIVVSPEETENDSMSEYSDAESNSEVYMNECGVCGSWCQETEGEPQIGAMNVGDQSKPSSSSPKPWSNVRSGLGRKAKETENGERNNIKAVTSSGRHFYFRNKPLVNTQKVMQARRKVIRLLLIIIGTFAVLTLPYHIRACVYLWTDTKNIGSLLSPICYLLYYMNSGLNPFLYAFFSDNFRKSLKDSFKCLFRK